MALSTSFRGFCKLEDVSRSRPLISFLIAAASLGVPFIAQATPPRSTAAQPSYVCYLQTESGQVVNLSKLCGVKRSEQSTLSIVDQQFLWDYQRSVKQRFKNSAIAQALPRSLQNPQALIQQAKDACGRIQSGMQPDVAGQSGSLDGALIKDLALAHYCPDLAD